MPLTLVKTNETVKFIVGPIWLNKVKSTRIMSMACCWAQK